MAIAKIEALPKFDLGSELVPWNNGKMKERYCGALFLANRTPHGNLEPIGRTPCSCWPGAIRDGKRI